MNWKAVAAATGLKNPNVAQTKYYKIKKKMGLTTSQAPASTVKTTPSKPSPDDVAKEEAKDVAMASKRGTKRKAKEAFSFTTINKTAEECDDTDDEQQIPESGPIIQKENGHEYDKESQGDEPVVKLEA